MLDRLDVPVYYAVLKRYDERFNGMFDNEGTRVSRKEYRQEDLEQTGHSPFYTHGKVVICKKILSL